MNQENHYYLCEICRQRVIMIHRCEDCGWKLFKKGIQRLPTFCSDECREDHKTIEHLSISIT